MDLQLDIVTPERMVFSGRATEVVIPGWDGQFGALPQHDNRLALTRAGVTRVITATGEKRFLTGRGFAEVSSIESKGKWSTRVALLTEVCEPVGSYDAAKAQAELDEATRFAATVETGTERARLADARLELARARVAAATGS
jgi:F-type H+-transporting ATPase subunit epsilon